MNIFRKKQKAVKTTFYIFVKNGNVDFRSVSFLFVVLGLFALSIGTWYTWYGKYHFHSDMAFKVKILGYEFYFGHGWATDGPRCFKMPQLYCHQEAIYKQFLEIKYLTNREPHGF